jgi:ClpP class serine protease
MGSNMHGLGDFFWSILWVFFIASAIQPLLQQRYLETTRQRRIARFERRRGSRVIVMVHRQETMRLLGFPVVRYIDIDDSEEVLRAIRLTDRAVPIDLVLHTPGGLVVAALQIARALRQHPAKVTVFVPHYAMSGGTLICLAANEIVMSPHAMLGPVDPQIGEFPAASLLKVLEQKPIAEIDDRTLVLADLGRKAIDQIRKSVGELLQGRMRGDQAEQLAHKLSEGTWTHDYPISASEAKALGLNVNTDIPADILDLLTLYPQPTRTQSGVEYLPVPRQRQVARREQS